jgi:hypothetical protein
LFLRGEGLASEKRGGSDDEYGRPHLVREIRYPHEVAHRVLTHLRVGVREVASGREAGADRADGHPRVLDEVPDLPRIRRGQPRPELDGVVAQPRQPVYRRGDLSSTEQPEMPYE